MKTQRKDVKYLLYSSRLLMTTDDSGLYCQFW